MSSYSPAPQGATTASQQVLVSAGGKRVTMPLDKVTTTDATPVVVWSRALVAGQHFRVDVAAVLHDNSTGEVADLTSHNVFSRSSGGTSRRGGSANGSQDPSANTWNGNRPTITFGDPSATHTATVIITGKAATTIDWNITITFDEGT